MDKKETLTATITTRNANVKHKQAEHVVAIKTVVMGDNLKALKKDNAFRQYTDKNGTSYKYWSQFIMHVFGFDSAYVNQLIKVADLWHRLVDLGLTTSDQPKSTILATSHLNDKELVDAWTRCTSGDKTQFVYYHEFRKYAKLHQSVAERDQKRKQATVVLKDDDIAQLVSCMNTFIENENSKKKNRGVKYESTYIWDDKHRVICGDGGVQYTVSEWLKHIISYMMNLNCEK